MTTMPQFRCALPAAPKAAAGLAHPVAGYPGANLSAGVAAVADAPVNVSGTIAPIFWPSSPRSRNIVAQVVTPAA